MIFRFKQFEIKHSESLLKVTTDAVLLGALVDTQVAVQNILDIGTGCGLIALMLAQQFPETTIDAIELDEPSYKEAAYNFSQSKFSLRLSAVHTSLQNFQTITRYDLIVSNPPYFKVPDFAKGNNKQEITERRKKIATRFSLNFEELISCASGLLTTRGVFWVIIPYDEKEIFVGICLKHKLALHASVAIRSKPEGLFIRVVLCFGFEIVKKSENKELTIYNLDNSRHDDYIEISDAFYL